MGKTSLSSEFESVGKKKHYRTIAAVSGEVGSGKTHLALTAPDPIVVFNIDRGLEAVADQPDFNDKEIYQHLITWSPGETDDDDELQSSAIRLKNEFKSKLRSAVAGGARTLVVDTGSRLWEIYRYAQFGAPNGQTRDYVKLNQEFEDFINVVKDSTANLFILQSMKNHWNMKGENWHVDGREIWGYEHLPSAVMLELFIHLDKKVAVDPNNEDPNYRYVMEVGKCRHNLRLQDTTIPRMEFPQLGRLLVPGTKSKDWM
jgi:hypothetical protein